MTTLPRLTPDPWRVLTEAVEDGIAYGLRRADKYADGDALTDVQRDRVAAAVYEAVTLEMSERFLWSED